MECLDLEQSTNRCLLLEGFHQCNWYLPKDPHFTNRLYCTVVFCCNVVMQMAPQTNPINPVKQKN